MRQSDIKLYRNIGIIAHIDAGKTTTTERILYYTGKKHQIVEVHDTKNNNASTTTDYLPEERARGITIQSAAVSTTWKSHQLNIIDTPGHVDFTIEVNRSLRVLDGAIVVFDSVSGVEPQTETNWRLANNYSVPRICYLNKMDRVGASFTNTLKEINEKLGANPIVLQLPIGSGSEFCGIVDLIKKEVLVWEDNDKDSVPKILSFEDLPNLMKKLTVKADIDVLNNAMKFHLETISKALEIDDELFFNFSENSIYDPNQVYECIRRQTIEGTITPIFCGSSYKNIGVRELLDGVVNFMPSPLDVKAINSVDLDGNTIGNVSANENEPAASLAFKVNNDTYGSLTFTRIYRGTINQGDTLFNASKGERERIGRMVSVMANSTKEIESCYAGDIVAFIGLKHTETGDTLCDPEYPLLLERMRFPEPVISVSIEPKTKADVDKLSTALSKMVKADPSLKLSLDPDTNQTILSGMGELHLDVTISRMSREYNVDAIQGQPKVSFRETFGESVDVDYLHKKQSGGSGQFARVKIKFERGLPGTGFVFNDIVSGGHVPREYIPSVKLGIEKARMSGSLAGFECVDFIATLSDGEYHAVDSSTMAFEIAGQNAFREAHKKSSPVLMEPIMNVSVTVPEVDVGAVMGQMSSRRGRILNSTNKNNAVTVVANTPLSEMFGYINELRSATSGRGNFAMEFLNYSDVPISIENTLLNREKAIDSNLKKRMK